LTYQERKKAYNRDYMKKLYEKQKAMRKFAKERITALLKAAGVYEAVHEESEDGFVMLQNWLLPKFCDLLRHEASSDYMAFDNMIETLKNGLSAHAHDLPERMAASLGRVDGRFILLATWIMNLSAYMGYPDEFNERFELQSFKAYIDSIIAAKALPADSNPNLTMIRMRVEKDGERKEQK